MRLLRSLVPSWKFFEDVGHTPMLFFRSCEGDQVWSEWQRFHRPIQRRAWNLFFNPELNLQLAEKSVLEQAISDSSPVTLKMIGDMIESHLPAQIQSYQFKISVFDGIDSEEIYLSSEIERSL